MPSLEEEFILELEVLQSESLENNLTVEGEFCSESTMESWGWSKPFSWDLIISLGHVGVCFAFCKQYEQLLA